MGFLQPSPPPFDLEEWSAKPYLSRLKPNAQDWAVNGFGAPSVVYLLYAVKLTLFSAGAFLLISQTTPGLGGLGDIGDWWTEPIVFQKLAVWILLWEIAGLGSGSMPLAFRFAPPIGGILYWLRPRTVRLPPWPDKVPLTRGSRRMLADVALYAGVLACGVYLLLSAGETVAGSAAGRLDPVAIGVLLGVLGLLGLRDKVFGEGHFHHHQLIEAIQEQCRFGEGDVRVVTLESQPAHIQRQRYRIYDAAAGLLEEGWVDVADMVKRGPWLEESWGFPVEVTRSAGSRSEPAAAS